MRELRLLCLCAILAPAVVQAQLEWRVSVKFIVDGAGHRPSGGNLSTDAQVLRQFTLANEVLDRTGRGYRFNVVEILDLPTVKAVTDLFDLNPNDKATAITVERAAEADKSTFRYRDDAINIYLNGSENTAVCSYPDGETDANDVIMAGQSSFATSLFHECGHYFWLFHTQGRTCSGCGTDEGQCNTPGDDEIPDTLPDLGCWNADQISANQFGGRTYPQLTPAEQGRVDLTWSNIMSYHTSSRLLLTADQLDKMTDSSNGARLKVATGRTRFVDRNNGCWLPDGSSTCTRFGFVHVGGPFPTVVDGVNAANPGDVVLIRPGQYNEPGTLNKPVTLRATRGSAIIGMP